MKNNLEPVTIEITGMGIATSIGTGIKTFSEALFSGKTKFDYLQKDGRKGTRNFIGAEISDISVESLLPQHRNLLRNSSWSGQIATLVLSEAWQDAKLASSQIKPERVGIVVGGSNFQQRYQTQIWQNYQFRPEFIRPTYGMSVWDTDLIGLLSQCFSIQGEGYSVGGASASGSVAIIHAARQIMMGITDLSIVVGSLFDLSAYECQAFVNLGAMGSERFADTPAFACRPFDRDADGFIYGEGCGAVILESSQSAKRRDVNSYGQLIGWGLNLDGNRSPNPSQTGEERAMRTALAMSGLEPKDIDYLNTHGTSSPLGDLTEVNALKSVGLEHCLINATKSLTGHCLTASGVIELIATLLQAKKGFCHITNNLVNEIDRQLHWVKENPVEAQIKYAISNSFAFGGINTSLVTKT